MRVGRCVAHGPQAKLRSRFRVSFLQVLSAVNFNLPPPGHSIPVSAEAPLKYVYPQRLALPLADVSPLMLKARALRRLHDNNLTGDSVRALHNYVATRTQLRDSESSAENISLLTEFICGAELQLARAYADRREFAKTLVHNIRALCWSASLGFRHTRLAVRMLARTAAIALKLKPSGP